MGRDEVIVVDTHTIPDVIRDPADRLIVATALDRRIPLVTKDERIRGSGLVATIW
jgi:PIN domain nuclease of toxin-antitoxin system